MNEEHKDSCECCKYYLREMELRHIKSSSLISTLRITVNQLKHKINYLKNEIYQVEESS